MKKYLITISVVGIISLVGIMYIQMSWLKTNINVEKSFLDQKAVKVLRLIGEDLFDKIVSKTRVYKNIINPDRDVDLNINLDTDKYNADDLNDDLILNFINAESVTNSKYLRVAFDRELQKEGFKTIKYHFGIVKNNITKLNSEISAYRFLKFLNDTINNKIYGYPLNYNIKSNFLNSLKDIEVLYLIIEDSKTYVLRKLSLSIGLMLFFTFSVITAIYISIRFILRQEQVEVIKTNFIDNMTHEFKTPISSISIALSSLKNNESLKDTELVRYFLDIIKSENQRMLEMVETILTHAIVAKGELRLDMTKLSVHDILQSIIEKHRLLLSEKKTKLESKLDAVHDTVVADKLQLKIALANIIENAIKYSKTNQPLHLKIISYNKDGQLIIKISDNGIGIKKDAQKHIFKKFYRVNTKNVHNVKGFGLGLSYTASILEVHNGHLSLESTFGLGTTFTIVLPLANNE